jgi:hypothetical protein
MKKHKFLLGLLVVFCVSFMFIGNSKAQSDYVKGEGILTDYGKNPPTDLYDLAMRMSEPGITSGPKGVDFILSTYACAGTGVLLIAPENIKNLTEQQKSNISNRGWQFVDLDSDTSTDGIAIGFGYAKWFDYINRNNNIKVDPLATVFQVGSLSKPVSAYGAFQMVDLKDKVINYVSSTKFYPWTIQANIGIGANKINDITFENIIFHRSGLNQNNILGLQSYTGWWSKYSENVYSQKIVDVNGIERFMPPLSGELGTGVLNGDDNRKISFGKVKLTHSPDTTDRINWVLKDPDGDIPDSYSILNNAIKYSGGGYLVMQLAMENMLRSGLNKYKYESIPRNSLFGTYMNNEILNKVFKMTKSTFLYNNSIPLATPYYTAYWSYNPTTYKINICQFEAIDKNYIYEEKAVAGLYSTVDDIGRFLFGIMKKDEQSKILYVYSPKDSDYYNGYSQFFKHTGSNLGWKSLLSGAKLKSGGNIGLVVLTNTGDDPGDSPLVGGMLGGSGVMAEIFDAWQATYKLYHK